MRKWIASLLSAAFMAPSFGLAEGGEPAGDILFYSEALGARQLYSLTLPNGDARPVGRSGGRPDHFPQWSGDGQKIVFESYRMGGWHSWVMDADGANARRVSNVPRNSTRHYEFDASFAPDNKTIIFINNFDLYTVTLDDATPRRLGNASPLLYETAPAYAPDMRRIVFAGVKENETEAHIYTITADGKSRRQLTSGQSNNMAPVWAPDGERLMFYSDRDGSLELYEMNVDGGDIRPILQPAAAKEAGFVRTAMVDPWDNDNGAMRQYRASYSPDGAWIAFSRDINGDRELFVCDRQGAVIKRITFQKGYDGFPAWRPQ
jgi:Tol biopolymer transport system component